MVYVSLDYILAPLHHQLQLSSAAKQQHHPHPPKIHTHKNIHTLHNYKKYLHKYLVYRCADTTNVRSVFPALLYICYNAVFAFS